MVLFEENIMDFKNEVISKCIDFLHSELLPNDGGMVEIGEGIRCSVSQYKTLPEVDVVWEAHKKYVDLHYVLCGEEIIRVTHTSQGKAGRYNEEEDFMCVEAAASVEVIMRKGTVLCLFPNDAHKVKIQLQGHGECSVTKVVFKIPVELFS